MPTDAKQLHPTPTHWPAQPTEAEIKQAIRAATDRRASMNGAATAVYRSNSGWSKPLACLDFGLGWALVSRARSTKNGRVNDRYWCALALCVEPEGARVVGGVVAPPPCTHVARATPEAPLDRNTAAAWP